MSQNAPLTALCRGLALSLALVSLASCASGGPASSMVVGAESATEEALRTIPSAYVNNARTGLHVAYFHTSHGTHVAYGLYGLEAYKAGDGTRFAVSTAGEAGKLDFQDHYADASPYQDLSQADANWPAWVAQVSAYLDDPANAEINVMMWSWCDITGHDVAGGYLPSMQALIDLYGEGGSRVGGGPGKARSLPVTFVFMTGHAYSDNLGAGKPKDQADLITAYCEERGYWCLDYYSIDSHGMDGSYYPDASDDSYSASAGLNFNQAWQDSHALGTDWFRNLDAPGGSEAFGAHLSQHVTSNRKAYAMWRVLAGIAGWNGLPEGGSGG